MPSNFQGLFHLRMTCREFSNTAFVSLTPIFLQHSGPSTFQPCFSSSSREDILKNYLNPTLMGKTVTAKRTKLNSKNFIPQMMAP